MQGKNQLVIGGAILLFGLLLLIGNILNVNLWSILFPSLLILIGVWLLFRPRLDISVPTKFLFIGNYTKSGNWVVESEERWMFVGDIILDMREAAIPDGTTYLNFSGFVGKIVLFLPESIGLKVTSNAFVTESKILGESKDYFLATVRKNSENYETSTKKIHLNTTFFVGEIATYLGTPRNS